jgi:hypothetical protein
MHVANLTNRRKEGFATKKHFPSVSGCPPTIRRASLTQTLGLPQRGFLAHGFLALGASTFLSIPARPRVILACAGAIASNPTVLSEIYLIFMLAGRDCHKNTGIAWKLSIF